MATWADSIEAGNNTRSIRGLREANEILNAEVIDTHALAMSALDDVNSLKAENKELRELGLKLVELVDYLEKKFEFSRDQSIGNYNALEAKIEEYRKLERVNAMNYAEKKAYAQFARDTLNEPAPV